MEILGIDVGGTGIKGAIVDSEKGEMVSERYRLLTPTPATPIAVVATIGSIAKHFGWQGAIGCGFPAAVRHGVACTAANISKQWLGVNVAQSIHEVTGCAVTVINDADAAGLAEMRFGAGRGVNDVVLIVTLGTGLGTAVFTHGQLLPNTELGHIEIGGDEAEHFAADIVRQKEKLSWKKWAKRVELYLQTMEKLLWPDLIIIGGGVSKEYDKFLPRISVQTKMVPAQMLNEAGIIGAALATLE